MSQSINPSERAEQPLLISFVDLTRFSAQSRRLGDLGDRGRDRRDVPAGRRRRRRGRRPGGQVHRRRVARRLRRRLGEHRGVGAARPQGGGRRATSMELGWECRAAVKIHVGTAVAGPYGLERAASTSSATTSTPARRCTAPGSRCRSRPSARSAPAAPAVQEAHAAGLLHPGRGSAPLPLHGPLERVPVWRRATLWRRRAMGGVASAGRSLVVVGQQVVGSRADEEELGALFAVLPRRLLQLSQRDGATEGDLAAPSPRSRGPRPVLPRRSARSCGAASDRFASASSSRPPARRRATSVPGPKDCPTGRPVPISSE